MICYHMKYTIFFSSCKCTCFVLPINLHLLQHSIFHLLFFLAASAALATALAISSP